MSEVKGEILKAIEEALVGKLSHQQLEMVIDEVTKAIKDYDIIKTERSLITYVDVNESILKRFCACMIIEGKSEKTIEQYRYTAEKMFDVVQKHFTEIGVYDIRYFLACKKQCGASNRTLENYRANLSAFFQWMTREEIITKNPFVRIPPIKCTEKVKTPFSTIEIDALRLACKNTKERALIEILLASGIRVSELTSMKIADINWATLSIHISNGKGNKERTVYINELAKKHLIAYLEECGDIGPSVFYNKKKAPLMNSGVRYLLRDLGERANVKNVHPHKFRRTFASGLAARGMDIQEIKKLMGHTNINTTMKYIYSSDEQIQNSYKRYIS